MRATAAATRSSSSRRTFAGLERENFPSKSRVMRETISVISYFEVHIMGDAVHSNSLAGRLH